MPYELSFSPEFFMLPDENNGSKYPHSDAPYSVWGALMAMDDEEWAEMCEDVFPGANPEYVDCDMVMTQIYQVNTCGDISSPVDVWIDEEGYHTVLVYEANGRPTE